MIMKGIGVTLCPSTIYQGLSSERHSVKPCTTFSKYGCQRLHPLLQGADKVDDGGLKKELGMNPAPQTNVPTTRPLLTKAIFLQFKQKLFLHFLDVF